MSASDAAPGAPAGHSFTKEQVAEFKAQFDAFDEDGGGTIENAELKAVLQKCGMAVSDAQVNEMIKEFDTDGDGVLDFGEFLMMMHRFNSGPSERELRKAMFEVLDENLDGLVSVGELLALWKRAAADSGGKLDVPSEERIKALLAEADSDKDGALNEDEFYAVVDACA